MGKSLIIKGANFAENAIERIGMWVTVYEGTITTERPTMSEVIDMGQIVTAGTETRISVLKATQTNPAKNIFLGTVDVNNTDHNNTWNDGFRTDLLPSQSDSAAFDYDFGKIKIFAENTNSLSIKLEKYVYD